MFRLLWRKKAGEAVATLKDEGHVDGVCVYVCVFTSLWVHEYGCVVCMKMHVSSV